MHDKLSFQQAEQVLERAVELEFKGAGKECVSLADVQKMAAELGVSQAHVHAAYRELSAKRAAIDPSPTVLGWLFGRSRFVVSRVIDSMSERDARERIDKTLTGQLFRKKRESEKLAVWEPNRGLVQSFMRSVNLLGTVRLPAKMLIEVELAPGPGPRDSVTDIVVVADFSPARQEAAIASGIFATLCVVIGLEVGLLFAPWAFVVAGVLALAGVTVARSQYRARAHSATEALEGLLDSLERDASREQTHI